MTVGIAYLDGPRLARTPTTLQPGFVRAFRYARDEADGVVAVFLSSDQSGTYQPAEATTPDQPGTLLTMNRFDNST